ncbi:MAG: tetratricopeptide repeat protein [Chloroflexaceae bacterium]|nr:tetratricopeptide repeat protein [Chloroflexaceae bacterium]
MVFSFDNTSHLTRLLLSPEQFELVRTILANYSGVYLDIASQRALLVALDQRLAVTGLALEGYLNHIQKPIGRAELQHLAELLLNHETIFFRNLAHMHALRTHILAHLHERKPVGQPIRIWSAGCSTGEEPYSLAILALESLGYPLPRPVEIYGTDLSTAALARARQGIYKGRSLTNVAWDMKAHYFEHREAGWSIRPAVRKIVRFEQVNLLEPFPQWAQGVDIIFCQNVTIYFQIDTFRSLVERFYTLLPEGGMLFLGFSETLWNVFDRFRLREIGGAFVYVKETPLLTAPATVRPPALPAQPPAPITQPPRSIPKPPTAADNLASPIDTGRAQRITQRLNDMLPPVAQPAPIDPEMLARGRAMLDAGQMDEVIALFEQMPPGGAHTPQALALLARAHANRGDVELAIAEARRALALDTLTVDAYVLLGVIALQQGRFAEAVQHLERARYLAPDAVLIAFYLAEVYRQLQRMEAALREYRNTERSLAEHPPDQIIDGVAVAWLRETCERYIQQLARTKHDEGTKPLF